MSVKLVTYLLGFLLISVNCIGADTDDNEIEDYTHMYLGTKVYPNDRQCAMVGGLCVHKSDCIEPSTQSGLCPSNMHRGVECCYELPMRPGPCAEHGGGCMDRCNRDLLLPGTDCLNGQICCLLV